MEVWAESTGKRKGCRLEPQGASWPGNTWEKRCLSTRQRKGGPVKGENNRKIRRNRPVKVLNAAEMSKERRTRAHLWDLALRRVLVP